MTAVHTTDLYFECHITIEPVFDKMLEEVKEIAERWGFRVADLLMRKRLRDTPERSQFDTFCTARSTDYGDLEYRMTACVSGLRRKGYNVYRRKIENTLLDVRTTR